MIASFEGVFTALVTPFRDGALDEAALRALVECQVVAGNAVIPCGTTGETPTLTADEMRRVIAITVEVAAGRVPVIAGAGGNATAKTVALAQECAGLGVDGLLVVTPYYNRPGQAGLEAHYRAVAEAVDLPVILYDVPGRTGTALSPSTTLRLAQIPNVRGIKEASGNVITAQVLTAALARNPAPGGFDVLCGDDVLFLPMAAIGAVGVVSVTANLMPEAVAEVVRLAREGRYAEARERHLRLAPVHAAMFLEPNPVPIKAAMHDAELCTAEVRLPLTPARPDTRDAVRAALEALSAPTGAAS